MSLFDRKKRLPGQYQIITRIAAATPIAAAIHAIHKKIECLSVLCTLRSDSYRHRLSKRSSVVVFERDCLRDERFLLLTRQRVIHEKAHRHGAAHRADRA